MSVYDKSEGASLHFDVPFLFVSQHAAIPEALWSYSGSAWLLFWKRQALIWYLAGASLNK